jgi:folate-binding protein YgfZ
MISVDEGLGGIQARHVERRTHCVRVWGKDARAFLHRLSTQHVADRVGPDEGALNAFVTEKGKMVALCQHIPRGPEEIWLVLPHGGGPELVAWLDRYLFMEDLQMADLSPTLQSHLVMGPQQGPESARDWARALGFATDEMPAPHGALTIPGGALIRLDDLDAAENPLARHRLLLPGAMTLPQAFAALPEMGAETVEALRIHGAFPASPFELNERTNPLELGLASAIHWDKGCYIGQEVIARIDTYQKVSRRLVGLELEAGTHRALGQAMVQPGGVDILVEDQKPHHFAAGISALGFLKVKSPKVGQAVTLALADSGGDRWPASVFFLADEPHA